MSKNRQSIPITQPAQSAETWYLKPADRLGEIVSGRYKLEEVLGAGGYAITYRALDTKSPVKRLVVLKILYIQHRPSANIVEDKVDKLQRFHIEAAAYQRLTNVPGFVVAIDRPRLPAVSAQAITPELAEKAYQLMRSGRDYYLVLQYMPYGSLSDRINRQKLNTQSSVSIMLQIGQTLRDMHREGIVHRDVKPDNIVFDGRDRPIVADLGTSFFLNDPNLHLQTQVKHNNPKKRKLDYVVGTPGYIPTEAYDRNQDGNSSRRDIYAWGVTFLQCLTGRLPIIDPRDSRPSHEIQKAYQKIIDAQIQKINQPALRQLIQRATHADWRRGYRTFEKVIEDLTTYINNPQSQRKSVTRPKPVSKRPRKMRVAPNWIDYLTTNLGMSQSETIRLVAEQFSGLMPQQLLTSAIIWFFLIVILFTWSGFFGAIGNLLLSTGIAATYLWRPGGASVAAGIVTSLLFLALSPILGLAVLVGIVVMAQQLIPLRTRIREARLNRWWLHLAIIPLASMNGFLALPLVMATLYKQEKNRLISSLSLFGFLSLWLTLLGQSHVNHLILWDPNSLSTPWFIDFTATNLFEPLQLLQIVQEKWLTFDAYTVLPTQYIQILFGSFAPALTISLWIGLSYGVSALLEMRGYKLVELIWITVVIGVAYAILQVGLWQWMLPNRPIQWQNFSLSFVVSLIVAQALHGVFHFQKLFVLKRR